MPKATRWLEALRELSRKITEEDHLDEAVQVLAELATDAAEAHGALVFLPSLGDSWLCEGEYSQRGGTATALGLPFGNPTPQLLSSLGRGQFVCAPSPGSTGFAEGGDEVPRWVSVLGLAGPLLYVPILIAGTLSGCLVLWRDQAAKEFEAEDGVPATTFAMQAALAAQMTDSFEVTLAQRLKKERERIARDLHDLAIQDLFATGMKLQTLRRKVRETGVEPQTAPSDHRISRTALEDEIIDSLDALERSVTQIRSIVYGLRGEEQSTGLHDRLRHEASMGRGHLGFAPTYVIEVDNAAASPEEVNERVDDELTEDVVAVMREALTNVARHANANSVQVNVEIHGKGAVGEIVVSIIDDGQGLDPGRTRHSGLANMQRRAALRGGTFGVGAGPRGRGTSLVWRAPLQ